MGERMPSFNNSRNPETTENATEKKFEWDPTNPRCEALIRRETVQQGYLDGMYSLEGRQIRNPNRRESPTVIETTIDCQSCSIQDSFQSEGMGFAPNNDSYRRVESYLQSNCAKLQRRGYKPGQIPKDLLPK